MTTKKSSTATKKTNVKVPPIVYAAFGLLVVGFLAGFFIANLASPQIKVTTETVSEQLIKCQDLVTAKLDYSGLVTYEEGHVKFIDKKGFTMKYNAEINVGVDLSAAKVGVDGKEITIDLPKSELKSVSIDPNSLEFYDQEYSLFNWQNRSDTATALELAKEDAQKKVEEKDLLSEADDQAKTAVEALFSPLCGDGAYTLNVNVTQ